MKNAISIDIVDTKPCNVHLGNGLCIRLITSDTCHKNS